MTQHSGNSSSPLSHTTFALLSNNPPVPAPAPSSADSPKRRVLSALPPLAPFFDPRRIRVIEQRRATPGWLARMRIRKKLIVIHSVFTIILAAALLLTLRPAVTAVVREAEVEKATLMLAMLGDGGDLTTSPTTFSADDATVQIQTGDQRSLGLLPEDVLRAMNRTGDTVTTSNAVPVRVSLAGHGAIRFLGPPQAGGPTANPALPTEPRFVLLTAQVPDAREAVGRLYMFVVVALIAIYLLVAIALELFVLPQNVYGPIQRMLDADDALRKGRRDQEQIPEAMMPKDEMGEIMRSRNRSIAELRKKEADLGDALMRLEEVATDLKRKNHLLEAAKRNLQDADRLASLGMMSAGVAHELNTPLAVVKGLTERLNASPDKRLEPADAALMLRVVNRLEGLGDSLLDYARVRTPRSTSARCSTIVHEAITLVRLDRDAAAIAIDNRVPDDLQAFCDPDRMVQVFVNLIRNAVDALRESAHANDPRIEVLGEPITREGRAWIALRIRDNGPGIDPQILPRLFEPFASTRLDSKGTGLGLAVAEGIIREHGGVLLAQNRSDRSGALFEVLLPATPER